MTPFRRAAVSRALSAAAFAALAAGPPAAAADDVLTPHDVAALASVAEATIAPDGRSVAYLLAVPRKPLEEDSGSAWQELHLALPDGTTRPFVSGKVRVTAPAWTPDGAAVAFLAKRGKDEWTSLYVIPATGGEARRLIAHGADVASFAFRPDGLQVAFLAKEARPKAKKELLDKGFDAEVYEEDGHPTRVWLADLAGGPGGEAGEPRALDLPGSASEFRWSPAGDRFAVALAPSPSIDDHYMARRVHVVDAATSKVLAKVDNPGKLGEVAWSPDGQRLAMISAADYGDPKEGRLMVASATAGGAPAELLPGLEGHAVDLAWFAPDRLLVLTDEGLGTALSRLRIDGSPREVLSRGSGKVWTSFSTTPDGARLAIVGEGPEHPPELLEARMGIRMIESIERRTFSNPRLQQVRLARQEALRFTARDGLALEAVLIHPLDRPAGARVPLIVVAHGGPEAHYSNGWLTGYSNPGQVAAARGFAVVYPNYRGSTGRGVAFSKLSQGDPAGAEFDDLVDAVDHLVAAGLVDRARVGITGGSYGGYATAWAATKLSDRFAAGVMFVGISEMISKMGTSDIPQELWAVHERAWPWEKWDFFLERSPVRWVRQAATPLLILGGTDDPRVHPSQSLALYRYLKLAGKAPVRLVRYPGEEHGNRKSAARLDYNLRMMQWLEHYLTGPGGAPPPPELSYEAPTAAAEGTVAAGK